MWSMNNEERVFTNILALAAAAPLQASIVEKFKHTRQIFLSAGDLAAACISSTRVFSTATQQVFQSIIIFS